MKRASALPALALLATPLAAQDETLPPWDGVWKGTIGGLPVMVCLQQGGGNWSMGSYYYLSQMKPIPLRRDEAGNWAEEANGSDPSTGTLHLTQSGSRLGGEWLHGVRHLAIALERVPTKKSDTFMTCGSYEYIAPRVRPITRTVKPVRVKGAEISRIEYKPARWFEGVALATIAIAPTMPGDRSINAQLEPNPDKPNDFAPDDYLSCMQGALNGGGRDGDYEFAYDLAELTPTFLRVIAQSGSYCGGAHPNNYYWWESFDRQTGKRIDLTRWFTAKAAPRGDIAPGDTEIALAPALRRVVLRHSKFEDAECRKVFANADFWFAGVTAKGVIFTPALAHVEMACTDDTVVPYAELTPFFSAEGKTAVRRLGLSKRRK